MGNSSSRNSEGKMTDIYLSLDKKAFEATKKEAEKEGKETDGETEPKRYLYGDLSFVENELYFDNGEQSIELSGTIWQGNKELGYISVNIPLKINLVVEIIEWYRKALGKIKTILEATK